MKNRRSTLVMVLTIGSLLLSTDAWAGKKVKKVVTPTKKKTVVVTSRHTEKPPAVASLPASHKKVTVKGSPFYYNAGVWYNHGPSGYVIVAAPIGARIVKLPASHTTVVVGGVTYYHYYGAYYRCDRDRNEYYVVEAPVEPQREDIATLIDGEVMRGRYLGGDESTVEFQVGDEVYIIDVTDIVSILFEPAA
jgi:hypothetical protein